MEREKNKGINNCSILEIFKFIRFMLQIIIDKFWTTEIYLGNYSVQETTSYF